MSNTPFKSMLEQFIERTGTKDRRLLNKPLVDYRNNFSHIISLLIGDISTLTQKVDEMGSTMEFLITQVNDLRQEVSQLNSQFETINNSLLEIIG